MRFNTIFYNLVVAYVFWLPCRPKYTADTSWYLRWSLYYRVPRRGLRRPRHSRRRRSYRFWSAAAARRLLLHGGGGVSHFSAAASALVTQ